MPPSPATRLSQRPSPTRALVTGCAGFIGSHLTASLLRDGIGVVGVDCFTANYDRPQKLANLRAAWDWDSFDFVPVDLATGELDDLVADVDVVFHLAAEPGVRSSWGDRFGRYLRNNVLGSQQLMRAIEETRAEVRVVYASSSSIYGQAETCPTAEDTPAAPISPYGLTKLSAEHLCNLYYENFGIETVSLRYFTVFGPRQRPDMAFHIFCRAALSGQPVAVFGDGLQSRDFTYVTDVVAATRAAATSEIDAASAYNVGGGLRATVRDILDTIEDVSGQRLERLHTDVKPGDVRDTGAATNRARADLAFNPTTSLAAGIAAQWEWLKDYAGARP